MGGPAGDKDDAPAPGVSPGQLQAMTGSPVGKTSMGTDLSGMTAAEAEKQMAVDQALTDAGYSKDYKGVSSGGKKGGVWSTDPKTGEKVAVRSGQFVNTMNQAGADYDYKMAEAAASRAFDEKKAAGLPVDINLSDLALGKNQTRQFITNNPVEFINAKGQTGFGSPVASNYSPGTTFSPISTNSAYSIASLPNNFVGPPRAGAMPGAALLASNLATGKSFAPTGNLGDPYGAYLGTTVDETNRDIATLGNKNDSYLDQFQEGYNSTKDKGFFDGFLGYSSPGERDQFSGKGDLSIDKQGNVGFQTGAQKFGDFVGEQIMGKLLGPIGMGFDFNTQTRYGTNVPGYNNIQNTTSFGIPDALGGLLGTKAAPYVGNYVGQQVYNKTGNAMNAGMSALASGAAAAPALASGTSAGLQAMGVPASINVGPMSGTSISSDAGIQVGEGAYNTNEEFAERLGGGGGGGSDGGDAISDQSLMGNQVPGFQEPLKILDTSGAYTGTDKEEPSAQSMFLQDNMKNYFANGSPISVTGQSVASAGDNPLFNANPAVTYRQSGGKNRNYGNAISNVVTPLTANNSFNVANRRKKFGDAMLGLFG